MLSSKAFISYDILCDWVPNLREAEKSTVENYIDSASRKVNDYLGFCVTRETYTEVFDVSREIALRKGDVKEITTVKYDPDRVWGEDTLLVSGEDYYTLTGDNHVKFLISLCYYQDSVEVVYDAGVYPLHYVSGTQPLTPIDGQVWKDLLNMVYMRYTSSAWVEIAEDLVIDPLLINAVVETILYYKTRIFTGAVGAKSSQGNGNLSYYQQMELTLPQNVIEMLEGRKYVL